MRLNKIKFVFVRLHLSEFVIWVVRRIGWSFSEVTADAEMLSALNLDMVQIYRDNVWAALP